MGLNLYREFKSHRLRQEHVVSKDIFQDSTAVVQKTVNLLVVGSIPTLGAKFNIEEIQWQQKKQQLVIQ